MNDLAATEPTAAELIVLLRDRCCGEPGVDHGHTDCWLHALAANKIEQLQRAHDLFITDDVLDNYDN
jgi:hypothetical protein